MLRKEKITDEKTWGKSATFHSQPLDCTEISYIIEAFYCTTSTSHLLHNSHVISAPLCQTHSEHGKQWQTLVMCNNFVRHCIILTDEYLLPQFKVPFEPVSLLFSYFFLQVLIIVCSYSHVLHVKLWMLNAEF